LWRNSKKSTNNEKIEFIEIDLGSLQSVRTAAQQFLSKNLPLHILINNAGIMATPLQKTVDGFESQFGTNHLAHFLLTNLLVPALRRGGRGSRVVCLSSVGHKRGPVIFDDVNFEKTPYDKWRSYGQSKSANINFAVGFNLHHSAEGITANAVHPGGIMTGLQKELSQEEMAKMGWFDAEGKPSDRFKTVEQGASTSVWAATSPELEGKGGFYLENCSIGVPAQPDAFVSGYAPHALSQEDAEKLWELSEKLLGQSFPKL